jgi:hypothetical protein
MVTRICRILFCFAGLPAALAAGAGDITTGAISSVRDVAEPGSGAAGRPPPGVPRIELFERRDFGGRSVTLTDGVSDFERIGFNDRADAAIVHGGVWRLCEHADFRGDCRSFGPGRHNDLGSLGGRVSSATLVAAGGGPADWNAGQPPRAVLFEQAGFGGRFLGIEGDVLPNLDQTNFNDRAASLRIEGGYWIFCTDAYFQGTCRTFGPGEYPSLPLDVDKKISSGRRISEPYAAHPSWTLR